MYNFLFHHVTSPGNMFRASLGLLWIFYLLGGPTIYTTFYLQASLTHLFKRLQWGLQIINMLTSLKLFNFCVLILGVIADLHQEYLLTFQSRSILFSAKSAISCRMWLFTRILNICTQFICQQRISENWYFWVTLSVLIII